MKRLTVISVIGLCAGLGLFAAASNGPGLAPVDSTTTPFANSTTASDDEGRGWKAPAATEGAGVDAEVLAENLLAQGDAALADGDMRRGLDSYRRAVEYHPSAATHGSLGGLYLKAAAAGDAAFHLRRAAELDPYDADRWLMLANAYFLKQDLGAAWKAVDQAKTVEPGIEIERDSNNFMARANAG